MPTKRTVLIVAGATGMLLLLGILAVTLLENRDRQSITRDEADLRHRRHHEVPATEFAPRSHGSQSDDDEEAP
jgi:hypothetical protein